MYILAVDSGLEKTGFSVFKKTNKNFTFITSGLIRTSPKKKLEHRVEEIYNGLNDVIIEYKPAKLILETLLFFKNHKTAITVAQTQGSIILLASQNHLSLEFLAPLQIKLAVTGYGLSDKKAVRKMLELSLKINKKIQEDDEFDAIACGLAYCYLNK
ncbi:hypothetical protein A2954_00420 [Candidatus Roizmanbacteria bacterium RIFCSPLOWO2_01_FULL_37_12]|uniref:crossover junction endodeoxyribonuclease n=1 Tax=Candidatus Roizmanbacteria bacterium RIFCSPLOWO2_01_FULL_37_12 TaxID=1802056 RepID=A0A1F7IB97_9BACT|nr:MAG: hypothetical protein A2768_00365 [Candidatus Roizmanbacteria bacterium RIFCSPHIGHO2_01_FULL_37_16]OGK25471.1 MAG: hypothetical protein A3D76_06850 [Candidatus Roizmanbacteria bacterium RIFCSPHIGHO2_02_FULL_37_9b]OGK40624.1 MAG: hypothetical protein A2954_00420 [Candidatus Roizmanbacteria bacterium RIFCSPLOWO2_01_FULL_37_12]